MNTIDWKDYIKPKAVINQDLIKPFAEEINVLNQSLTDKVSVLKEKHKIEIQRLQLHKITNLDQVIQRHSLQISKLQDHYHEKIKSLMNEQKTKIVTFGPPKISYHTKEPNHTLSVSFGTVMPKIYHVDFQVYSDINHNLDNSSLNGRVNYISSQNFHGLSNEIFYKEAEKSTEFFYPSVSDQLEEIKESSDQLVQGDFFITRHSNLNSKALFHLIHTIPSDCKSFIIIIIRHYNTFRTTIYNQTLCTFFTV